ncbi:ribosome biogenesis GTP-binding protein YsxC [Emergomyces africanus]|uniref:Ribosome biogenesis GTP-binding protein YsxC n=1 Tax=Emergomyces africanus TaxID=1955775 RepID=A0A1B7NTR7_9EURO|nr:ribosome biogenesis GTP-binding protein YsxC [Emergomyces africanus]
MVSPKSAASIATNTAKNLLKAADRQSKRGGIAITSSEPIQLQLTDYSFYYDTAAPSTNQLQHSANVFRASKHSPVKMWTASEFRTIPMSDLPEVAFLGRSNVGKSSLLNAIMEKEICFTSSKIGRTRTLNAYGIGGRKGGEARVVLVDTPGYGKGSHEEWGEEIIKYLTKRKQLRRTFILLDSHHGIKPADASILSLLRSSAIPHQVILSKADSVLIKGGQKRGTRGLRPQRIEDLRLLAKKIRAKVQPVRDVGQGGTELGIPALGEILACSSRIKNVGGSGFLGVDAIRWAILRAAGLGVEGEEGVGGVGVGAGVRMGMAGENARSVLES